MSDLEAGIAGFSLDLWERDTDYYKMNRMCADQIVKATKDVKKSFKK